jgi:hypothetical protein
LPETGFARGDVQIALLIGECRHIGGRVATAVAGRSERVHANAVLRFGIEPITFQVGYPGAHVRSCKEQASLDSFGDRGEEFVPHDHVLRVLTPCLKGGLVGEIVAHRKVHVPGPNRDISPNDNILSAWEWERFDCLHEGVNLLSAHAGLQPDQQDVAQHATHRRATRRHDETPNRDRTSPYR